MKKLMSLLLSILCAVNIASAFCIAQKYAVADARYAADLAQGGTLVSKETKQFTYARRTDDTYKNPYEAPTFIPSMSSACAIEAGGNAVVYFDRLYDELIPDYSHKYVWGKFTYGTQNTAVSGMFSQLYNLMGTTAEGTTVDGFKSGLSQYASSKGRRLEITDATGSYCNIDMEFVKQQLRQEKLAVIFLDQFSITDFSGYQAFDGYDEITYNIFDGYHTMLLYGYKDVNYYDASGTMIGRETYFYASTGYNGARLAFVNINRYCTVNNLFILNIV